MLKSQRQESLVRMLESDSILSVADLAKVLKSSMMTIRRDLADLEKRGLVKRVHGGVLLSKTDSDQPSFNERITESSVEKHAIGKAAAALIRRGQVVFFDAGTTALAVVDHIPDDLEFTALTTGLLTAIALCGKRGVNLVFLGGSVHKSSFSTSEAIAVEEILKFHADLAFITTKAFHFPEGTYEAQLSLIEVKRAMASVARKTVLLADHGKFGSKSLSLAIPLEKIDVIITDAGCPIEMRDHLSGSNKTLIIA